MADGLQKNRTDFLNAGKENEGQIDPQALYRKLRIKLPVRTEHPDKDQRECLEQDGTDQTDDHRPFDHQHQQFPHPPEFFCAIVVPDNGLCAGGDPNGDVQHDLKQFQNHHKGPQGNVRAVGRKRAVLHQQDIVDDSDDHDGQLRQKAGRPQCHDLLQQPPVQPEAAEGQAERPASGQISRADAEADKLSQDGGIGRALDAHVQCENGHRVTDDIQHRPRQMAPMAYLGLPSARIMEAIVFCARARGIIV